MTPAARTLDGCPVRPLVPPSRSPRSPRRTPLRAGTRRALTRCPVGLALAAAQALAAGSGPSGLNDDRSAARGIVHRDPEPRPPPSSRAPVTARHDRGRPAPQHRGLAGPAATQPRPPPRSHGLTFGPIFAGPEGGGQRRGTWRDLPARDPARPARRPPTSHPRLPGPQDVPGTPQRHQGMTPASSASNLPRRGFAAIVRRRDALDAWARPHRHLPHRGGRPRHRWSSTPVGSKVG